MSQQESRATLDAIKQKLALIEAEIAECKKILRGEKHEQ